MEVDLIRIFNADSDDIVVCGSTHADMIATNTVDLDLSALVKTMAASGDEKEGPPSKKIKKII